VNGARRGRLGLGGRCRRGGRGATRWVGVRRARAPFTALQHGSRSHLVLRRKAPPLLSTCATTHGPLLLTVVASIRKAPPLLSPRAAKHGPVVAFLGHECLITMTITSVRTAWRKTSANCRYRGCYKPLFRLELDRKMDGFLANPVGNPQVSSTLRAHLRWGCDTCTRDPVR
jgi:hypothetical protein